MAVRRPAPNLLRCEHCGGAFPLREFPSHSNVCLALQTPTSGPSFNVGDSIELSQDQEDEVEALRTILLEDFEFDPKTSQLSLTVQCSSTHVRLLVRYTGDYPQTPPKLAVRRLDNNISKERAAQLLQHLKEEAEELSKNGSVFIFELYDAAKRFLDAIAVNQSNLHDEFMQQRQQRVNAHQEATKPKQRRFGGLSDPLSESLTERRFEELFLVVQSGQQADLPQDALVVLRLRVLPLGVQMDLLNGVEAHVELVAGLDHLPVRPLPELLELLEVIEVP
jgi:hypothetical protein